MYGETCGAFVQSLQWTKEKFGQYCETESTSLNDSGAVSKSAAAGLVGVLMFALIA
jgi:hypothetical protein